MKKSVAFLLFMIIFTSASDLKIKFKEAVSAFNAGDCQKALNLYDELVNKNDPNAIFNYGTMYEKGSCVEKDYKKAREFYEKAAKSDNNNAKRLAMYRFGLLLITGRGSDNYNNDDAKKAVKLWENSRDLGYFQASLSLGILYFQGSVIKKDDNMAMKLFTEACSGGVKEACNMVANLKVE